MTTLQRVPAAPPATRPPIALSAATFISNFDRFAISPMLVLIASGLKVPLATAVAAASGYFLAYGLSQPLWGLLSDRIGRVRVIRAALLIATLAGTASALATDLPVLVAARIVAGACVGAVIPTSLTYVGDTVPAEHRQRALSDLMATMALGTAVATGVGGALAQLVDWHLVFATSAAGAAACSIALRTLPEPPHEPATRMGAHLRAVLRNRWALLVFGLAFAEGAVLLGTMTLLAAALQSHGATATMAGLATATYGIGVVASSRLVKALTIRMPVWSLIAVGGAQICLGYGIVASQVSLLTVTVTALLLGGGWSFMHSSLQTWATSLAPRARGTTVSLFAGSLFVGSAVAASIAGPLVQRGQYPLLFTIACAMTAPLTLAAVTAHRRWSGDS
jgi:predicted MFS family arabinose efflux permease